MNPPMRFLDETDCADHQLTPIAFHEGQEVAWLCERCGFILHSREHYVRTVDRG